MLFSHSPLKIASVYMYIKETLETIVYVYMTRKKSHPSLQKTYPARKKLLPNASCCFFKGGFEREMNAARKPTNR